MAYAFAPLPLPLPCSTSEEPPEHEAPVGAQEKEGVHKTKTVSFLGRTIPIVLQNDNGPCPLLAICNVLLLKNRLHLSPEISEVSQEKLLSLIADRLIDSNSNVNDTCAEYVESRLKNIADAIDLLPRLATGIDVNIKFKRIDDFEFTTERAIFHLLDIPLYHGWIVDPQDYDTAQAIGYKSYNALMGELVALEPQNVGDESNNTAEEVAAATPMLGVPSPCLSKATSFNDSLRADSDQPKARKGDLEEEAELLTALKLSESEFPRSVGDSLVETDIGMDLDPRDIPERSSVDNCHSSLSNGIDNLTLIANLPEKMTCSSSKTDGSYSLDQSTFTESGEQFFGNDKNSREEELELLQGTLPLPAAKTTSETEGMIDSSLGGNVKKSTLTDALEPADTSSVHAIAGTPQLSSSFQESGSSSGKIQKTDTPETFTSSIDGSDPIGEGEDCILDSVTSVNENQEPIYEDEVILAEQADKIVVSKAEITPQQGELIRNFLKNNASQLTFYGLFCLQDGLRECELCVFFRNNHFSTMFKYDGELYLLATDQGYINQPDLVWEKLNEVNGDTLFITGNFKEFQVDGHPNETWDEHTAVTHTADYLAGIDNTAQAGLDLNADLQLAIALQQQEFEQQQPQSRQHNDQQPSSGGGSRLMTRDQARRSSGRNTLSSPHKDKSNDKCVVM